MMGGALLLLLPIVEEEALSLYTFLLLFLDVFLGKNNSSNEINLKDTQMLEWCMVYDLICLSN